MDGALAAMNLDGTWTFTGTFEDYDGFTRTFNSSAMLARTGAGYCGFALDYSLSFDMNRSLVFSSAGDLTTYIDDSVARAKTNVVCSPDGTTLKISYSNTMHVGEGIELQMMNGALTR